ncbi:GNAT family N-acetyltransferase [Vibrio vulnificus]|nr:GNAT family N-acetyltransferase [Vibrio vulnificus]RZQ37074.1 GNAT family N-acetyltransferase [Vibrio vulnificus]
MTRRLSGIHAAWHFWFAVSFGGESVLRKAGLGGIHPLTQRYMLWAGMENLMIETERLILRPVESEDLDIYTKLFTSEETTRYLPGGKPYSSEYIANYVPQKVNHWSKGYGTFIVSLKSSPEVKIGYAGVEQIPDSNLSDIRYGLLSEYQGKGYAFEAAKAVLNFTFGTGKVSEVYGVAVIGNFASEALLKKLGMQHTEKRIYDSNDLVTFFTQTRI